MISNFLGKAEAVSENIVSIPQLGWGDFKLGADIFVGGDFLFQSLNWDGVISNRSLSRQR